jgi:hypothetical protein
VSADVEGTKAWAAENRACWEIVPLVEMYQEKAVQVGFELSLFARIPDLPASHERPAAVVALWDRLRDVAESLAPLVVGDARIEVDPFDAAGRLRPETQFAAEVMLQARIFHSSDYFAPASAADREHLRPLEQRLAELGFRAKAW